MEVKLTIAEDMFPARNKVKLPIESNLIGVEYSGFMTNPSRSLISLPTACMSKGLNSLAPGPRSYFAASFATLLNACRISSLYLTLPILRASRTIVSPYTRAKSSDGPSIFLDSLKPLTKEFSGNKSK